MLISIFPPYPHGESCSCSYRPNSKVPAMWSFLSRFSSSSTWLPSSTSTPHPEPEPKRPKPEPEPLIPSLPDDVALNCLARVPRSQYPTLNMVSKPIRSLLSSPLFFNARSLLHGTTDHFLYVTFVSLDVGLQWFALCKNPNDPAPVPLPPIPSPSMDAAYAVVGPNIYVIGGSIPNCKIPSLGSPHVWVLDCRFNRWRPGPAMRVARRGAVAGVVDGKIYVMGGCRAGSSIWAEVLDPVVGRWDELPSPPFVPGARAITCQAVDGKVYVKVNDGGELVYEYDRRDMVWESVDAELWSRWRWRSCVVDGVLYSCRRLDKIKGLDVRQGVWKELKGLDEGLLGVRTRNVAVANVGGKLLAVWRSHGNGEGNEIWCAEIEVKRNGDAELWGKVCWSRKTLSIPSDCLIVQCSGVVL